MSGVIQGRIPCVRLNRPYQCRRSLRCSLPRLLLQTLTFLHIYGNVRQPVRALPQRPHPLPLDLTAGNMIPPLQGHQRGWYQQGHRVATCNLFRSSLNKPLARRTQKETMTANKNKQTILWASGSTCFHLRQNNTTSCSVISARDTPCTCVSHPPQTRLAGKRLYADTFWSEDGTVPRNGGFLPCPCRIKASMQSLLLWLSIIVAALMNATLMCWSCRFGDFMQPPIQVRWALLNAVLYWEKK